MKSVEFIIYFSQIGHSRPDLDFSLVDSAADPTRGSGGGDVSGAGRGGGRIVLQTAHVVFDPTAVVSADGSASVNPLAGGGSGGSVSIYCKTIEGYGIVSVIGGAGFSTTETGGGSGGRIFVEVS